MRIAIIQFPGSNCERETMLSVQRAEMEPVPFLWNNQTLSLADCDGYIIVGGFSYEDRARAGVLAALDPLMGILKEQSSLGKPILGICNGAQILVEAGLVPGLANDAVGVALTDNQRVRDGQVLGVGFYNAWINMRLADTSRANAFTRFLTPNDVLSVPVAHAQGRFVMPEALLAELVHQGLACFQYCDAEGSIIDEFPVNPNGSLRNIAALSNPAGNVMAMMPHPERTGHGDAIFRSMRDFIEHGSSVAAPPLSYRADPFVRQPYQTTAKVLLVHMMIVDNEARSVEATLRRMGMAVSVARYDHWAIECDDDTVYQRIVNSGVLYHERKEKPVPIQSLQRQPNHALLLVQAHEDVLGPAKQQTLTRHCGIAGVQSIRHSVVWRLSAASDMAHQVHAVLNTHILFNRNAHDCYSYDEA